MISGSYIYREGESRYQFYLRKYAGVDENGVAQYYKDITDAEGNVTGQEKLRMLRMLPVMQPVIFCRRYMVASVRA